MDTEKKFDIFHPTMQMRMWEFSLVIGILVFIAAYIGVAFLDQTNGTLQVSKALAGTGAVLIGISFSLSGFCYYWDFLDKKIAYRKYIGLVGYWFAFAYSFSLLFVNPDRYLYGFFKYFWTADFLLGVTAMAMLTFMAVISNNSAMRILGPHRWRVALRIGYLAWLLLAVRAWILENDLWREWFLSLDGFPPLRLVLTFLVILVVLFRLSVDLSKFLKQYGHKDVDPSSSNNRIKTI